MKVEVAILGSPTLTVHGLCGRKAALNLNLTDQGDAVGHAVGSGQSLLGRKTAVFW